MTTADAVRVLGLFALGLVSWSLALWRWSLNRGRDEGWAEGYDQGWGEAAAQAAPTVRRVAWPPQANSRSKPGPAPAWSSRPAETKPVPATSGGPPPASPPERPTEVLPTHVFPAAPDPTRKAGPDTLVRGWYAAEDGRAAVPWPRYREGGRP